MVENNSKKRLLVIDDQANMRHMLATVLKKADYVVDVASDGAEGLQLIEQDQYDFILCDIKMPNMGGLEFLEASRDRLNGTTVIMMSAYGSIDTAIGAMKLGAYDYISKPFKTDEVYLTLKKAEERENLKKENRRLKERIQTIEGDYNFGSMVAKSKAMRDVFQLAEKAAQYKTTVLILGGSGTGKELIARGIHQYSQRSEAPLVPVNCGGIPETLLESELFGYKKGAFTGADRNKKGLFQEAESGTILLDEIGELPLNLQVKLLRVLQENEIRPIGDSRSMKIDVRVVAATAKNLEEEVHKGTFRKDLYYRLNVLTIKLPPLRQRTEDIPLLCKHFLHRFNNILGKEVTGLTPDAMVQLLDYDWPGNVRELENVLERAVLLSKGPYINAEDLPTQLIAQSQAGVLRSSYDQASLKESLTGPERAIIRAALEANGWNRQETAKALQINRTTLYKKMKRLGLEDEAARLGL